MHTKDNYRENRCCDMELHGKLENLCIFIMCLWITLAVQFAYLVDRLEHIKTYCILPDDSVVDT